MSKATRTRIADVITDEGLKHGSTKKFGREIAAYLLDTGRTRELDPLLRDVQSTMAERGYVEVYAVSAHDLNAKVLTDIKSQIRKLYPKAKKIEIIPKYDAEIIGGVRIELADRQLDLSIESKLNKFKQLTSGD